MVEIILCCSCSGTGSGHSVKKKSAIPCLYSGGLEKDLREHLFFVFPFD